MPPSPLSLTPATLHQLTPPAAKIYLALLTCADQSTPAPIATLSTLAGISPRSARRALAQLRSLSLIQRLPRHYHKPNSYLLSRQNIPANHPLSTASAPVSPFKPPIAQPNTPATTPKTPKRPPLAHLLNTMGRHHAATGGPSLERDLLDIFRQYAHLMNIDNEVRAWAAQLEGAAP